MKHLELFAGIGGFRRATDLLASDGIMNFESIGFSEIDPKAITTYKSNFDTSNDIEIGDIVSFTENKNNIVSLPDFNFLSGGFPCQTFSMMGKQTGFAEERGQMFFRIIDILKIKRPKYVLLENVKNLRTHDKGRTIEEIKRQLESLGYKVFFDVFNTSDFHLPQTRNRLLIFATTACLPKNFTFDSRSVVDCFDKAYKNLSVLNYTSTISVLSKEVDLKYFLSDRIKPTLLADGSANFKSNSEINLAIARPLTATMHKMHRACQDNYYSQDFIESNGAINPAKTHSKEDLAKLPIRKLTPEEAFLLQGFPSSFATKARAQKVSDGALYKQAGNAVSVNTIYAVLYYLIVNKVIKE